MKIISWNVNGIRAVAGKGLFEFLDREQPDIFCMQETKAHPDQLSDALKSPLGYHTYWSSAQRKGYSGTSTWCKKPPVKVEHGMGLEHYDSEGRLVVSDHGDFVLFNIYFPNGASREERHNYKQEFLRDLLEHLNALIKKGREIVLVGDYNVAYLDFDVFDPVRLSKESGFLPEEREWFRNFLKAGFTDTFRHFAPEERDQYTWWSYRERAREFNRGWRIDHICVTKGLLPRLKSAKILMEQMGSDHCPVSIELE